MCVRSPFFVCDNCVFPDCLSATTCVNCCPYSDYVGRGTTWLYRIVRDKRINPSLPEGGHRLGGGGGGGAASHSLVVFLCELPKIQRGEAQLRSGKSST